MVAEYYRFSKKWLMTSLSVLVSSVIVSALIEAFFTGKSVFGLLFFLENTIAVILVYALLKKNYKYELRDYILFGLCVLGLSPLFVLALIFYVPLAFLVQRRLSD